MASWNAQPLQYHVAYRLVQYSQPMTLHLAPFTHLYVPYPSIEMTLRNLRSGHLYEVMVNAQSVLGHGPASHLDVFLAEAGKKQNHARPPQPSSSFSQLTTRFLSLFFFLFFSDFLSFP